MGFPQRRIVPSSFIARAALTLALSGIAATTAIGSTLEPYILGRV